MFVKEKDSGSSDQENDGGGDGTPVWRELSEDDGLSILSLL